jgi:DNA polymerase-3 subunit beta
MKFIVNKDEFIRNLGVADSIINVKSPLAILLNVYLEVLEDGTILMLSYNGENGVKVETTGVVETPGKISLLSKKLLEAVKKIPGEKIVFESKSDSEHEIIVHPDGQATPVFHLNGVSGDTYPIFSEFNWKSYIKLSQETLVELINSTAFASSTDASKPAFSGTYVEEAVEGHITFVTTDGKKLSIITRPCEEKVGTVELGVIIPEKIFHTIGHILTTGEVLFSIHDSQAFFKVGNVYLFSNLVEGKFPNYRDVIPTDRINIAVLSSSSFLSAIDIVSVMCDVDTGKTIMELGDGKMVFRTTHPIYGQGKHEIPVEFTGSPISVAFNYKSMQDFLKVLGGKPMEFIVNSQSSPMLLKAVGDDNYLYISMPLKLHD